MDPRDLLVAVLSRVPLRVVSAFCWMLAWTWWWLLPIRKAVAVDNLRRALPELNPRPVLTRMMHDILLMYVEILQWDRLELTVLGAERVRADPGPLLASHTGAWDIALVTCGDNFPSGAFLRSPTDPWARRRIEAFREAHHVKHLSGGMGEAYRWIADGNVLVFVQDQHFAAGVASPFFGRPAKTSLGFASALRKSGRSCWTMYQYREGVGRHVVRYDPFVCPPLTGDQKVDLQAITDAGNAWLEGLIRERPHGWLWLHRRWK